MRASPWILSLATLAGCGARVAIDAPGSGTTGTGGATITTSSGATTASGSGAGGATTTSSSAGGATSASSSGAGGTTTTSSSTGGATTASSSSGGTVGELVELAKLDRPFALALDEDYVYVTTLGTVVNSGQVVKLPKSGGAPITLASGLPPASFMVVDATDVYFMVDASLRELRRLPKNGGPMTTVHAWSNEGCALAVDAARVYCAEYAPNGTIFAFDKGNSTPIVLGQVGIGPRGLLVDEDNLFWVSDASGAVGTMPKKGGPITTLATASSQVWGAAMDATGFYWGAQGIEVVPKGGGKVTVLATEPGGGDIAVAVDATNVYWAHAFEGGVRSTPKNGGPITVLATGQGDTRSIAVDGSAVYWASLDGQVMRRSLP